MRSSPKAYTSMGEWVGDLRLVSVVFFNHLCIFVSFVQVGGLVKVNWWCIFVLSLIFLYFCICMSGWAS